MRRNAILAVIGLTWLAAAGPAQAVDSGWTRKVSQLIGANYSYPRSAQVRGEQGSAKVKIGFSASGKVLSVNLVKSTGSAILDREAVRIPTKIGTFPPPPAGVTEMIFPITWRINEE